MPHQVTVATGQKNVVLPDGSHHDAGAVVLLTDAQFATIPSSAFPATLVDNGEVLAGDAVAVQAPVVAAPAALTSSQNATAAATDLPTSEALANALKANYNQLQADVAALQLTVANLLVALKIATGPMAAS